MALAYAFQISVLCQFLNRRLRLWPPLRRRVLWRLAQCLMPP